MDCAEKPKGAVPFAAAYRRDPIFALTVADELIDTLSVTNPAIYRSVIRKLQK